jgi:hypothetical protein
LEQFCIAVQVAIARGEERRAVTATATVSRISFLMTGSFQEIELTV